MTIQLDWPAEVVDRLTEEARQRGLSLDIYVLQFVPLHKASDGAADTAERRDLRRAAAASIRELRKANVLGPDLTLRDLIEEGRRL